MGRNNLVYQALLFRGWELVRLRYEIDGKEVIVREKHTWTGVTEKRVAIGGLSSDTRRVWSRQPANWVALLVLLIVGMALGYNLLMREGGIQNGQVYWPLWGPGIALGSVAWFVMWTTRGRREWAHFLGREGRTGLFVLREKRNAAGHQAFVEAVKRKAERE